MKKLLSILASIGLTATASGAVVSCTTNKLIVDESNIDKPIIEEDKNEEETNKTIEDISISSVEYINKGKVLVVKGKNLEINDPSKYKLQYLDDETIEVNQVFTFDSSHSKECVVLKLTNKLVEQGKYLLSLKDVSYIFEV